MIQEFSVQTNFHVDIVEKVYRLTELLKEITKVPAINDKIVLKGGTAINFIYFNIPRLSVDIDIDYIGSVKQKEMLNDRKKFETILPRVFKKLEYTIESRGPYALLQ